MFCPSFRTPLRTLALTTCFTALLPLQALAQDKVAYVIGNARFGGPALENPAKDAVSISRALLGLGFNVVRRQNVNATDFPLGTRAGETVALYYSGRTAVREDGDILMRGAQLGDAETAGWPLLGTIRAFQEAGAKRVLVFVETCQADGDRLALPAEDVDLSGVFLAMSHDPNAGCPSAETTFAALEEDTGTETAEAETTGGAPAEDQPQVVAEEGAVDDPAPRFTERVRLALATPDMPVTDAMDVAVGGGWVQSALTEPFFFWPQPDGDATPSSGGSLPAGALEMLASLPEAEQARMREVWQNAGLINAEGQIVEKTARSGPLTTVLVSPESSSSGVTIVAPVATPINPVIPQDAPGGTRVAGRVTPVQPVAQRPQASASVSSGTSANTGSGGVTNAVQIFTPAPRTAAPAALPTAAGLPEPYLIFGELQATNASFSPTETGEVEGNPIDTSSFETRNQIRNDTPDLYAQLVAGGAFDPADGSTSGLARAIQTELARMNCYTSTIDGVWGNGSRGSVTAYFQQISEQPSGLEPTLDLFRKIILNDDVSCPVVQQAAQPARATGNTTTRTNTNSAPAVRTQQPVRQQAPATTGGINTNNLGTGVFR